MTWLVFAVSGLLVLAGAVSVTSGAPIIQLERGWAEVISGTVAISSGGVVFALGMILMRLESLREAMSRPSAANAAVMADRNTGYDASAPASAAAVPQPSPSAEHAVAAAAEPQGSEQAIETSGSETSQGLWKRIKRPADEVEIAIMEAAGFPDRVASEPQVQPPIAQPVPAHVETAPEPPPATAPEFAAIPSSEPLPAAEEPGQLGWLERSLFKGRPGRDRVRDAAGSDQRVEPALHGLLADPAPEPGDGHPASVDPSGGESAPHAVPADEGPTVIGRYQAGVASYVMYSDGTIEVETESGQSHRFNSMDELKAFIAKQDKAGA